jgi:hypothetical protein
LAATLAQLREPQQRLVERLVGGELEAVDRRFAERRPQREFTLLGGPGKRLRNALSWVSTSNLLPVSASCITTRPSRAVRSPSGR